MRFSAARVVADVQELVNSDGQLLQGVCIDYFDTLVHRSISPEHTKVLAARRLRDLLRLELSHSAIYEIRSGLEKSLCEKNALSGYDPEFNLRDIAEKFYDIFKLFDEPFISDTDKEKFVKLFSDIEVAVEVMVQRVNPDILELLRWLHDRNTPIYLISDFYIPAEYFRKMLKAHGTEDLFSDIFISADYLFTKNSGKLYTKVCSHLGCKPGNLLMIGDNEHSDFLVPQEKGLRSFAVETEKMKKFYKSWEVENSDKARRQDQFMKGLEALQTDKGKSNFAEMGFTLWFFITKLFNELTRKEVKNVLFCSKEGEFLKKLFDCYQDLLYGRRLVSSHYLLVSRKATYICSLQPIDREDFGRLFLQYRDISIEEFLLSLNFSKKQVEDICRAANVEPKERRSNLQNDKEFKKMVKCELFQQKYEQHRIKQRNGFHRYIDSFGIDFTEEGLNLVDVGWNGSIQNNIYHALGGNIAVKGYYIGLLSPNGICDTNTKKGLIFSDYQGHTPFIHVYNNNRSLFEMLLGASHGSADGYFPDEERLYVEKERNAVVGQLLKGIQPTVVTTLDLPEERSLFKEKIYPLQDRILSVFLESLKLFGQADVNMPDEKWFAKKHARMVFKPTRQEVNFYANLYHLENFGIFEFTGFSVANHIGISERLKNLRRLIKAPEQYLETGVWPPIILRRLGLDFLQPIDGKKRFKRIFEDEL